MIREWRSWRIVAGLVLGAVLIGACGSTGTEGSPTVTSTNPLGGTLSPSPEATAGVDGNRSSDVDAAVAAYRASGAACAESADEGDTHQLLELDGIQIVSIACVMSAYQGTYELRLWDGATLGPLDVEQWRDNSLVHSPTLLGFPFVEGGRLKNLEKARGVGDCGLYQEWVVDGSRLMLSVARARDCDDPGPPPEPDEWPRVYSV